MKYLVLLVLLFTSIASHGASSDYINVNTLVDFETSTDGTTITATIMTNATRGNLWSGWFTTANPEAQTPGAVTELKIEEDSDFAIYTPIRTTNGIVYADAGTRGMRVTMAANNAVQLTIPDGGYRISIGCFFRWNGAQVDNSPRDVVAIMSGEVAQMIQMYDGATPYFWAHQGSMGTFGNQVNFAKDTWYWITMRFAFGGEGIVISFYNTSDYSLVGTSTLTRDGAGTGGATKVQFGLLKYSASQAQTFDFDNFVVDPSGTFPLGPGGGPIPTKWVSTDGIASWANASSSDELSGTNCASIATLNSSAVAGDKAYLRGGPYTSQINLSASGTPSSRINIVGYNSEVPVFTNITDYGVELVDNDYVSISGIWITNCSRFVLLDGSFDCRFTNVIAQGAKVDVGNFVNAVRITGSSSSNRFYNCTFRECGWENAGNDESRVICIGTDNSTTDLSHRNLLYNCIIARGGHDTMTIFSAYNRVENCFFYNDVWYPSGSPQYGNRNLMIMGVGSVAASGYNFIRNNTFFRAAPPPDAVGVSSVSVRGLANNFGGNVFLDGADAGININRSTEIDGWTPSGVVAFNHVFNNTVVYNGINTGNTDPDQTAGITLTDFSDQTPPVETNYFKNNILWNNVAFRGFGFEGVTSNANTFLGNRNETSDPLFVSWSSNALDPDNIASQNFNLTFTSSSIDAGVWLTTITSGSGSGTSFVVADSLYFTDGEGIWVGDEIQLQGQPTTRTVTDVNYTTHTITVSSSVTWTSGDGVALRYYGSAPDQGAFESNFQGTSPVQGVRGPARNY